MSIPLASSNEPSLRALEHKNQIETCEKYAHDSFITVKNKLYSNEKSIVYRPRWNVKYRA